MKELADFDIPDNYKYSESHEWSFIKDYIIMVGISDYAQEQLGDIIYVELPKIGRKFKKGEECVTIESAKAVSDISMPLAGEIVEINNLLETKPDLLNSSPNTKGWIFKFRVDNPEEYNLLLDKEGYLNLIRRTL